mmetsp:Transcript_47918/g.138652  ORF Transcript_47918/g.138652 Transcript_47918/m.138652 type:complete len:603 (-) Transcript_47918:118-1926(-)
MGAVGSQRPPHVVELRLEYPQAPCSSAFYARVHSEADGVSKYRDWGRPQAVSLWADDVITVAIYTAGSQEDFDKLRCQGFAEVYIPWSIIYGQMAEGVEVVFNLGLKRGSSWLGHNATLAKYLQAFYGSYRLAEENPSAPHLRIGIRMAPPSPQGAARSSRDAAAPRAAGGAPPRPAAAPTRQPAEPQPVASASNAVASGVRELSPEEMTRLFRLQVRSQALRARLGLEEGSEPAVEEQVEDHVAKLRQAIASNYGLRAEQQVVDQELATTTASLTQEGRLIVTNDVPTPPRTPPASGDLLEQDPEEHERRATVVMAEIQAITKGNIELISDFDEQIKVLEAELLDARRQPSGAPEDKAGDEEATAREREASQSLLQQDEALRSLEQEIDHLQRSLEASAGAGQMEQPDTRALQAEEEIAQVRKSISQEQAATEEQRQVLRRDLRELEEHFQAAMAAKLEAQREIGERQQVQDMLATTERDRTDEQLHRDTLEKELSRSRCRIGVCDEKIQRLRDEAADIRERAALLLQASPDMAGGRSPRNELELLVGRRQEELRAARASEEEVRQERDNIQQALEAAKVEAAVLEQKMRLLRSRIGTARG